MQRRNPRSGTLELLTGLEQFAPRLGPKGFVMMMSLPRRSPQFASGSGIFVGTEDQVRFWGR